ncbi:unnamed protein product [Linum trigynum]|uniref:Uncharacterized protein n=1 Tax=Linum trigynum TaxID=586398 RepID=A0AAV2EXN4_9ROSI
MDLPYGHNDFAKLTSSRTAAAAVGEGSFNYGFPNSCKVVNNYHLSTFLNLAMGYLQGGGGQSNFQGRAVEGKRKTLAEYGQYERHTGDLVGGREGIRWVGGSDVGGRVIEYGGVGLFLG